MSLSRRKFFSLVGVSVAGTVLAAPIKNLYTKSAQGKPLAIDKFGSLQRDPQGILDLPPGFQYGQTMFVNIYHPGMTLAISGKW